MDTDRVRRYAEIKQLIASKEGDVKELKKQAAELEEAILEEFADEGVPSMAVKIGSSKFTVYSKRDLRAHNLQGPEATAEACRKAGLGHMVHDTVNSNTLSAYLRDLEKAGEDLPDSFEGVVAGFEKFSVGVRAS